MRLSIADLARLRSSIERWKGTPYKPGLQTAGPQGGVDCVRFVDAVYRETFLPEVELTLLPREAQDAALHDRRVFFKLAEIAFGRYGLEARPPAARNRPQAGDILAVRAKVRGEPKTDRQKNPHHVLLVGPDSVTCWHAVPGACGGVVSIGIGGVLACYDILAVWFRSRP